MPIGGVGACESPNYSVPTQPSLDMRVFGNVLLIIIDKKPVFEGWPI
jgi:hypothetical protein